LGDDVKILGELDNQNELYDFDALDNNKNDKSHSFVDPVTESLV
jgi:hypothetical protein